MKREKLIKIISPMGLTAEVEDKELVIRDKNKSMIACVDECFTYDMTLFEDNVPFGSNIDVDFLANTLFEYAKTPLDKRDLLTKEEKQRNLFKTICSLADQTNEVNSSAGFLYKTITFTPSLDTIEEIRSWINE